jgi:SAM-dependent methyltransferase
VDPPDDRATLVGARAGRSLSFDRVADTYDATRGGQERADRHAALLAPRLDPSTTVLEIGVGTGAVASVLVRHGFSVTGVDISVSMLRHARARLRSNLVAGDAERLPLRTASIPQAYAVWVLHLVGDLDAVVAEAGRVLVPGGRLVIFPAGGEPVAEPDAVERITLPLERLAFGGLIGSRPTPERIGLAAARAGLRIDEVELTEAATFEESPATAADKLEQRTFSMCWDIDDATYEEHVAPVVAALRALPDADRPMRRSARREHAVVLRRPHP